MKTDITKLLNVDAYDADSYYSSLYYPHLKWIIDSHCVRSVRIRCYSGPYFPTFGLYTERYLSVFSPNAGTYGPE